MMELLIMRDMILDDLGNYYIIYKKEGNKLFITNAQVFYSFNRKLDDDFVKEVNDKYGKSVCVGKYFLDIVESSIYRMENKRAPGGIYSMGEVLEKHEIVNNPFYSRNLSE